MRHRLTVISCILLFAGCATSSLQSDVSKSSTAELKRRDARLREDNRDWRVYEEYYGRRAVGTSIHDFDVSEVRAVDDELLRRYRAGDRQAWIPAFRHLGYRAPR
jgi:hypothetical protein